MLSPLLVKSHRTYKLLGTPVHYVMRVKMTNTEAMLRACIIPFLQIIILLVFTFTSPPLATSDADVSDGEPLKQVSCMSQTSAFSITQNAFMGGLLLTGCILAYLTRNIDPRFGDAKTLLFVMYNVAFTAVIIGLVLYLIEDISETVHYMLRTVSQYSTGSNCNTQTDSRPFYWNRLVSFGPLYLVLEYLFCQD